MAESKEAKQQIAVKPYTLKELSRLYGVDWRTLKSWIEPFHSEIGDRNGRYFQIRQVEVIFKKLDLPYLMDA